MPFTIGRFLEAGIRTGRAILLMGGTAIIEHFAAADFVFGPGLIGLF